MGDAASFVERWADRQRPLEILGGLYLGDIRVGALTLEGGARPLRDEVLVLGAGGEVALTEASHLRGGWRLEDGGHDITFGAGAGNEAASLDLGLAIPTVSVADPGGWTVQLSIRFEGPDVDAIRPE